MAIVIKKEGNIKKFDLVCPDCDCEFSCTERDLTDEMVSCPMCGKNILKDNSKIDQEKIKKKIKEGVFEEIDFEKIHQHMEVFDWKWGFTEKGYAVPTIEELEESLGKLIDESIEKKATISSGGFTVRYREFEKDGELPHTIGVDVCFYISNSMVDVDVKNLQQVYY